MARIIQARLDPAAYALLEHLRATTELTDSEIVRRGIKALADSQPEPAQRRVIGVGKFRSAVKDLGSNKRHLKGFGKR